MAALGLAPPRSFMEVQGEPPIPWNHWKTLFQNFLLATDMVTKADSQKMALLRHCLGTEGQRVVQHIDKATLTELITACDTVFTKKTNVMVQRFAFRNREQKLGEPITDFVRSLQQLASSCNFGDLRDEMIRDQLVFKTSIARVRERLLMEEDSIALDDALKMATQIEAAIKEAQTLTQTNSIQKIGLQKPATRWQQKNTQKPKQCFCCGKNFDKDHKAKCPAKNKQCTKCGKMNHFAAYCKSKTISTIKTTTDSEVTPICLAVFTTQNNASNLSTTSCNIGGETVECVIDSGAVVSVLSLRDYERIKNSLDPISPADKQLTAYGGTHIATKGKVTAMVEYKQRRAMIEFYVASGQSSLIGKSDFHKLGISLLLQVATPTMDGDIQQRFPQLFNGIGKACSIIHKPVVNAQVTPRVQAMRRIPFSLKEKVTAELKRLETEGIIEKTDASPWVSNIVVVEKSNGQIRLCVDLREVNKAVIPDRHPTPTVDELAAEIQGARFFSKLDMKSGYLQFELEESSRHLTSFHHPPRTIC